MYTPSIDNKKNKKENMHMVILEQILRGQKW